MKGFTLIETIIYSALISIIIVFAVIVMYQIIDVDEKLTIKTNMEAEGEFIMQKINWALNGTDLINQPLAGATSGVLSVNQIGSAGNPFVFDASGGNARLSRAGNLAVILNNERVIVDSLIFEHLAGSGATPAAIKTKISVHSANSSLYSQVLETIFYLRK